MTTWRRLLGAVSLVIGCAVTTTTGAVAGQAPPLPPVKPASEIIVRVDVASGYSINSVTVGYPVVLGSTVLASRGIYLLRPTDSKTAQDPKKAADLAKRIAKAAGVTYAETDLPIQLADTQFHSWPYGSPRSTMAPWLNQPAAAQLQLDAAHQLSAGAGETVAVLDTGVDASQPALAGKVLPGWDYVSDDPRPSDRASGTDSNGDGIPDSAVGHGTFVSGLIALVAPQARILPERVLDSDGNGNVFVVAQAILDAVDAGAQVINLSFGTGTQITSRLFNDAVAEAQRRGVVVVAAAGNDASEHPHYPASQPGVVSVGALDSNNSALAAYSNRGPWVAVAAPGTNLVGPSPSGGYVTWSGTSMAAPIVAGQVALLRAAATQRSANQVTDAIDRTTQHLDHQNVKFGAINIVGSLRQLTGMH
jgi:hypothetical protein